MTGFYVMGKLVANELNSNDFITFRSSPFAVVLQNRCSLKFRKFPMKAPVLESLSNNVAPTTQMFSCEICEIFKNIYFREYLRWLLLYVPLRILRRYTNADLKISQYVPVYI